MLRELTRKELVRVAVAELVGSALLLSAVVGSGIAGVALSNGNLALALLANSIATGAVLFALIYTFASISGAHFNPIVTLAAVTEGSMRPRTAMVYVAAQIIGAILGVVLAHAMFDLDLIQSSPRVRNGMPLFISEMVATFGLIVVIHGTRSQASIVPLSVAGYVTGGYWFTSSTCFANPAVTIARTLTDTFAGIRLVDAPSFVVAQLVGGLAAALLFRWLLLEES